MSLNGFFNGNGIFGSRTRLDSREDYIKEILYYRIRLEELIKNMEAMFRYSNTFYSGESEGLNWVY